MKKLVLLMTILSSMAIALVACAPTGGEPEAGPMESTSQPAVEAGKAESNEVMNIQGLEGVRWALVSYRNAAGELVDILADTEPTAEFGPDGQMSGNSGCNSYFATYTVDGESLTIGQAGSTLMACEPAERMQQEADFLAALQLTASYVISGDRLEIYDADGATLAVFQATQAAGLVGTEWTASMVNNGKEAVTNVLDGTTITANFTEDGKLNGSAGCNNYMTGYTLDGQNITIEPPATTRKLCPEPEGVMEQEAAFTVMLAKAATYSISGNVLELRTAEGALIVSFTAAN